MAVRSAPGSRRRRDPRGCLRAAPRGRRRTGRGLNRLRSDTNTDPQKRRRSGDGDGDLRAMRAPSRCGKCSTDGARTGLHDPAAVKVCLAEFAAAPRATAAPAGSAARDCSTTSSPTSSSTGFGGRAVGGREVPQRPRQPAAGALSRSTSPSTSQTRPASCFSGRRRRRSSGAASTSTPTTCCGRRCRIRWWFTSCAKSTPTRPRSRRRSKTPPSRPNAPTSLSLSPGLGPTCRPCRPGRQARRASYVGPGHVLLALAEDAEAEAGRLLSQFGVSHTQIARRRHPRRRVRRGGRPPGEQDQDPRRIQPRSHPGSSRGQLDPVIGRADEIEQTIEILSRRTKNNPV